MRLQLVQDWKKSWKFHSVRFGLAMALLPELVFQLAVAFGDVLPSLPSVVLEYMPPYLRATLAVCGVVSVALRLLRQIKLESPPGGNE